ncbi:hypothetical protein [Hyunsoonleella pacifica]|uniref:Copper chaperone n=1 Tax=Hyunsoonleella pacifica TaxID=1080224 RepID=A0A4Q9FJ92_9FLAO|nr:hypothetical protein [Hyunsoonleella pacifica]TBN13757.1 hypothetical protein EYD46_14775 [Hyunsoonleella pacifica]GGD25396.1 hypothetical protein GCM10011368_29310 [Hyunsoonleella pacifica]
MMTNFHYFNYEMNTQLFILRTNIETKQSIKQVKSIFDGNADIIKWSVDIEDIDNVLKIEATTNLSETDIINQLKTQGIFCDVLPN